MNTIAYLKPLSMLFFCMNFWKETDQGQSFCLAFSGSERVPHSLDLYLSHIFRVFFLSLTKNFDNLSFFFLIFFRDGNERKNRQEDPSARLQVRTPLLHELEGNSGGHFRGL